MLLRGYMDITQSTNATPKLSLTIKASVDAVWNALRDKEKLLQWHGWDTSTLEDEIENIYFTDIKEEVGEDKRTLRVNGGDTFSVESVGADTRLTLVRAGLSGNSEWDAYYGNITEGWVSFIEQLRFMLERDSNTVRKTTFTPLSLNKSEVLAKLGLSEEKEGTKFSGEFQGEEISGRVWFSTQNQLGLVVNEWGPGLLIIQFSENGYITTRLN